MEEDQRKEIRRGSDRLFLEILRFHRTLLKILNGEYESFSDQIFEIRRLKDSLGRREEDHRLLADLCNTLESIAQRVSEIYSRRPRKVHLTKVQGKGDSSFPIGSIRIGWEESKPEVGKRYYIYLDDGRIFRTGIVQKITQNVIYTPSSAYSIEVIEDQ